jgi:hypothetical protein
MRSHSRLVREGRGAAHALEHGAPSAADLARIAARAQCREGRGGATAQGLWAFPACVPVTNWEATRGCRPRSCAESGAWTGCRRLGPRNALASDSGLLT